MLSSERSLFLCLVIFSDNRNLGRWMFPPSLSWLLLSFLYLRLLLVLLILLATFYTLVSWAIPISGVQLSVLLGHLLICHILYVDSTPPPLVTSFAFSNVFSTSFRYILLNSGEIGNPCAIPRFPPALRISLIKCTISLSFISWQFSQWEYDVAHYQSRISDLHQCILYWDWLRLSLLCLLLHTLFS